MNKSNILKKCLCGVISGMLIMQCSIASAKTNIPAVVGFSLSGVLTVVCSVLTYYIIKNPRNECLNKASDSCYSKGQEKNNELGGKDRELNIPQSDFKKEERDINEQIINLKMSNDTRRMDMISVMSAVDEKLENRGLNRELSAKYRYARKIALQIEGIFKSFGIGETDHEIERSFHRIKNRLFEGNKTARDIIQSIGEHIEEIRSLDEDQNVKMDKIELECFDENHINQLIDSIYNYFGQGEKYDQLRSMEQLHDTIMHRYR